jgi:GT2 family glycosyltransferase
MKGEWSIASVTVSRNPGGMLSEHMKALLYQTRPLNEIIVIDNASTDGTVDTLRRCYPQVTLLPLHTNTGVGGAYATSLTYAVGRKHDWIWLFDQDSLPQPNALELLVNHLNDGTPENSSLGVVATLPVNPETGQAYFGWRWDGSFVRVPDGERSAPFCYVDTTISSGSLIRRDVVERVGLPRSDFFMDFVDHEYNLRIRRHGFKIAIVPCSVMFHSLGKTRAFRFLGRTHMRATEATWRHFYMSRNETYTVWHEFGTFKSRWFLLARLAKKALMVLFLDPQKMSKMKMIWAGFWDGVRGRMGIRDDVLPEAMRIKL